MKIEKIHVPVYQIPNSKIPNFLSQDLGFSNWKKSRNLFIFQFEQFQKYKISNLENSENCELGKLQKLWIWKIPKI